MRCIEDRKLGGFALLYDGALEVAKVALDTIAKHGPITDNIANLTAGRDGWMGRSFDSQKAVVESFSQPWQEGMSVMQGFLNRLQNRNIAPPVDRRRKARWSDTDGEVCADRAMQGEPEYMRRVSRHPSMTPSVVTIVANIGGNFDVSSLQMTWRGAAVIAAVDLLESAGYSCEVIAWNRCERFYSDPVMNTVFSAVKIKSAGDPVDLNSMVNSLHTWFFRRCIRQARTACPFGKGYGFEYNCTGRSEDDIGSWIQYIDSDPNHPVYQMPVVLSEAEALEAAATLLAQVEQGCDND